MKQLGIAFSIFLLLSCGDSELDIESVNFDDIAIEQCGTATITTEFFFKRNGTEALILEIPTGFLENNATEEEKTGSIPSQVQLRFRVFDDNVTSTYFCADFPPASPSVLEELTASDGQLILNTVMVDSETFEHTLQLQGVTFENNQGERITDLTLNEFGTVTTSAN